MNSNHFIFDPGQYELPNFGHLEGYRIWDTHYHGFLTNRNPFMQNEKMLFYVKRMGIERVISVDIGGHIYNPLVPDQYDEKERKYLKKNKSFMSGLTYIDPGYPKESVKKMEYWIENGPCIGIKYAGGNPQGVTCDHPNNDIIIQKAAALDAIIYIHTWMKVGGSPRRPGGGNNAGESTPMDVVRLAKRFPDTPFICGHAGGNWGIGIQAIRSQENVFMEFAGSDPESGGVDLAVNELGADRIVWGGHGPSRSYATELAKVFEASISESDRMKILGANYRRIAKTISERKGIHYAI